MQNIIIPKGEPDVVNLIENHVCCNCEKIVQKRKQMWKYPDGQYMCIFCKTKVDKAQKKINFTHSSKEN